MEGWSIFDLGAKVNCAENSESNVMNDRSSSIKSDDDVEWGDCDDSLRSLFDQVLMVLLRGVYAKNGSRSVPVYLGDGRTVDLFKLFCLVRDRGGYHSVSENKLWGLIVEKFGFECTLSANLKLIYFKYLDELDQWLNRITRDRVSANGSYECGGSLGLLSLELEKKLRNFTTDEKDFTVNYGVGYDKICKNVDVAVKENLGLPDAEEGAKVHNVIVVKSAADDDRLCDTREFAGIAKESANDGDSTSRKRKRDMFGEMLSWMIKVAKNPCNPSIGVKAGSSRRMESSHKDFWSTTLLVREARLQKRFTDSTNEQSCFNQKKQKMHPSMYEDDIFSDHLSAERVRCSKRLLSLANIPLCQRCKSSLVDKCNFNCPSDSALENGLLKLELENADVSDAKRVVVPSVYEHPFEKDVLVGPQFQVEVPIWSGIISGSDSKWLGTQIWVPELEEKNTCEIKLVGKGRPESCKCSFPGSVECYRFHVAENKVKLRRELGLAFYHWKFDHMGEEVSLSWSAKEEKRFKDIIRLHKPFLSKSFFPKKTGMDLVSYYYNVFLIKRRSYQNRVTPKDIDSDDDETDFGSVSAAYGYKAVKVKGSEPLTCIRNEQAFDFN